jgi:K+/H+ antiporter YhaU regulatory subunit KhtT
MQQTGKHDMAKSKAMVAHRTDEMELLRLRHENASLNQLFDERAAQIASLLDQRAKLRGTIETTAHTLEQLAHQLRTMLTTSP